MDNIMLRAALKYAGLGLPVFPLHNIQADGSCSCTAGSLCDSAGKHPLYSGWQQSASTDRDSITQWWTQHPEANIGIPTGKVSGWLVLDVDTRHGGDESLAALAQQHGSLPSTVTANTGSGGQHRIFQMPDGMTITNRTGFVPGLDIRADGGYIVAAPSNHKSGCRYRWAEGCSPKELTPAPAPEWLLTIIRKRNPIRNTVVTPVGKRNDTLTSLAGSMRARGMSEAAIFAALQAENKSRCTPPLNEYEIRQIAHSVLRYAPKPKTYHRTDAGNAERLIDTFGEHIRYCHAFKHWLIYDGRCWQREIGQLTQYAILIAKAMLQEAADMEDVQTQRELFKFAMQSQNAGRIKAMIELASNFSEVSISPDDLDADIWLLNCRNGVIDLKTGELLPHNHKYKMTKLCSVDYDPDAKAPIWDAFLDTVTGSSTALARYKQKIVGSCLSGDTSEQSLFILYGSGANGKSTFLTAVASMLGDGYAKNTPAESFTVNKNDSTRNDLARLQGARLVTAVEVDEGKRLSEALIKSLSGGDKLTARFLYGEYFDYIPQFKVLLSVNHRPVVRDTSHSIWRRIKLIPFLTTIDDSKKDKKLSEKLNAELPGILAWAVKGCLLWQQEGLDMPSEVTNATAEYKSDMDTFAMFFDECCVTNSGTRVEHRILRRAYEYWCHENGEYALGNKMFTGKLRERGFESKRSGAGGNTVWHGLAVAGEVIPLN